MPTLAMLLQSLAPLLQATSAAQSADVRFMEWAIRLAPILITIVIYMRAPSRESEKKREKDLSDLLTWKELQQAMNTQHQLAMEKLGDEVKRNHQETESKFSQFGDMKTDVAVMKNQMQGQADTLRVLNEKMDRLLNQNNK